MKVAVTGSCGRIGGAVIRNLIDHGHEPVGIDQKLPDERVCRTRVADMTKIGEVYDVLDGVDAVIHLAAIPSAGTYPDHVVFSRNVTAHYNVLEVAETLGIRKAATASSIQALGHVGAKHPKWPASFPVDERYVIHPEQCYALSKQVGEEINEMFARRGMQALSLRFTGVIPVERVRSHPNDTRGSLVTFWSYVDPRDAADACRRAIEVDGLGAEAFLITAADTQREEPSAELIRTHFPQAKISPELTEHTSCVSIEKARRLLGYDPQYTWRE